MSLFFFWYIINENRAEEFCPCDMVHKLEGSSIMEIVRKIIISEKPLHCMGYRCVKHSLVLLNIDCNILVVLSKVLKISLYWFCVFCLVCKYFRQ